MLDVFTDHYPVPDEWVPLVQQRGTIIGELAGGFGPIETGIPPFLKDINPCPDPHDLQQCPHWDYEPDEGKYKNGYSEITSVGVRVMLLLHRLYSGSDRGLGFLENWYAQVDDILWEKAKGTDGLRYAWDSVDEHGNKMDPVAELDALVRESREAAEHAAPHDFFDAKMVPDPVLTRDMVPAVICDFAFDRAERLGVEPALVLIPALAVCAAAITDSVKIQPLERDDTFTQSARLWVAAIADSAVGKTPAIDASANELIAVEQRWVKEDRRAWAKHERELAAARKAGEDEPDKPKKRRTVVQEFTMEALAPVLADNPRGVLALQDELSGLIASFDAYRQGGTGKDQAAALSLHNGGPRTIDRKKAGASVVVPNWGVSIVGGIQINKMRQLAPKLSDDGFIQRFQPFFAKTVGRPQDRLPDARAIGAFRDLVRRLTEIPCIEGRDAVVLLPSAHTWRRKVDDLADAARALPVYCEALKQHMGKWRGLYARLLLTLHVLQTEPDEWGVFPPVPELTAKMAHDLMIRFFFPNAVRFYGEFFAPHDDQARHARWVAGYILAHKVDEITARDVKRAYRELASDSGEVDRTFRLLAAANWLEAPQEGAGRPTSRFRVNPTVHTRFAERAKSEAKSRKEERKKIEEARRVLKSMFRDADTC